MRTAATQAENQWWRRFERCLKDMPPSLEVLVSAHGHLSAAERGTSDAAFARKGNVDNLPTLDLSSIVVPGIEDNSGSM